MSDPITMAVLNNSVPLDMACWNCDGGKKEQTKGDGGIWTDGECDICEGIGYELTNAGEAILELVKRHLNE